MASARRISVFNATGPFEIYSLALSVVLPISTLGWSLP